MRAVLSALAQTVPPEEVLVWDDDGQTRVSYTAPAELGARYGLSDELSARLAGIDGLADALVST